QAARDDETIAAIVAGTAEHRDGAGCPAFVDRLRNREAGVLHQVERRRAVFGRELVRRVHLLDGEDFGAHRDTLYNHCANRRNEGMAAHICFLRGVNVGGKGKVPMAELKTVLEKLGFEKVKTVLQSGNVVFTAKGKPNAKKIEAAIEKAFKYHSDVHL